MALSPAEYLVQHCGDMASRLAATLEELEAGRLAASKASLALLQKENEKFRARVTDPDFFKQIQAQELEAKKANKGPAITQTMNALAKLHALAGALGGTREPAKRDVLIGEINKQVAIAESGIVAVRNA